MELSQLNFTLITLTIINRLDINPIRRMMAGQTASIRIRGGADARMGWTWFYIFLHALTVFGGGSGALCLNRRRIWTFGTVVALVLVRRFLLCQSFLFPEFSTTILEPYLKKIESRVSRSNHFAVLYWYFKLFSIGQKNVVYYIFKSRWI